MMQLVGLLCLVAACFAAPHLEERIVGGNDATIQDNPWQVSIQLGGSHVCGGSIIAPLWVLSAGRCALGQIDMYTVRAGSGTRGSGGTLHNIVTRIPHPMYNDTTHDYDLSLFRVTAEFAYGPTIAPIGLPAQDQNTASGTPATITGWGSLTPGGPSPIQLQTLSVPVTSDATCQSSLGAGAVTARMICAGVPAGGVGPCLGDDGGPLIVNEEVIGVYSWGRGCALANSPSAYGKVSSMRDWVRQVSGV